MAQEPTMTEAAASSYRPRAGARTASRKTAVAAKKGKAAEKPGDGLSRGALAGRIAAGAAIGSAAIAGALLFAGKIDGKTPKRVWQKVKPPAPGQKRAAPKKTR
jgi:hypothetical protein